MIPIVLSAFLAFSCNRDDNGTENTHSVNDFIWKGMNFWYYWQKEVPALADHSYQSSNFAGTKSNEFFYSLLYNYPNTDRFSWIVEDVDVLLQSFSGISKSSGMDFSLYLNENKTDITGIVNYVVPNSPADRAGIKRGDLLTGVNGSPLTTQNYTQLQNDQYRITILNPTTGNTSDKNITAVVLEENPIAFTKTFDINGKKIGYLVYNGFRANYNDELNAAIASLKQDNITDLILDLRYNGGGSVTSAVALGQMITGQFTGKPFVSTEYNAKVGSQLNRTYTLTNKVNIYNENSDKIGEQTINSLQLNQLYVLTSSSTASASELTIDGLRAYIPVTLIGSPTYGKFVGSITLFDSPNDHYISYENRNKNHKWAMQPITFAYYNAHKTPHPTNGGGLSVNHSITPREYFGTLREFGEYSDIALRKALSLASGTQIQATASSSAKKIHHTPVEFLASTKTMQKFGTEAYLNPKD